MERNPSYRLHKNQIHFVSTTWLFLGGRCMNTTKPSLQQPLCTNVPGCLNMHESIRMAGRYVEWEGRFVAFMGLTIPGGWG